MVIQVKDGNDPPVFRRAVYKTSVSEDAAVGTPILTVSAVDRDVRPRNSQFSYNIAEGDPDNR